MKRATPRVNRPTSRRCVHLTIHPPSTSNHVPLFCPRRAAFFPTPPHLLPTYLPYIHPALLYLTPPHLPLPSYTSLLFSVFSFYPSLLFVRLHSRSTQQVYNTSSSQCRVCGVRLSLRFDVTDSSPVHIATPTTNTHWTGLDWTGLVVCCCTDMVGHFHLQSLYGNTHGLEDGEGIRPILTVHHVRTRILPYDVTSVGLPLTSA